MRRYVRVASLKRGAIDPPEPVSADTLSRLRQQDAIEALPSLTRMRPKSNSEHWRVGENGIPVRIIGGPKGDLIRMLGR